MAITVYYGNEDNTNISELEPLSLYYASIMESNPQRVLNCPAVRDFTRNIFVIKYPFDYQIEWDGKDITSKMYNQEFYDKTLFVRDLGVGLVSFKQPDPIFYTECESLEIELIPAFYHKNDLNNSGYIVSGRFDIAKHVPRRLEAAYKFARHACININVNDALFYVRFNTQEEIIFKKFFVTDDFKKRLSDVLYVRDKTKRIYSLQWWYDLVTRNNYKKYFLKEIKNNLL